MTFKDFDNDDFGIVKKQYGGSGGGAPQNKFSILGAKILLKNNKKKANKQRGGQNDCENLAEYNCNLSHL